MPKRMLTNTKCPLCGEEVEAVKDVILKQTPHYHNVEMVVTKRGLKQYIHSNCWYGMIEKKEPYNAKWYA